MGDDSTREYDTEEFPNWPLRPEASQVVYVDRPVYVKPRVQHVTTYGIAEAPDDWSLGTLFGALLVLVLIFAVPMAIGGGLAALAEVFGLS